MASEETNSRSTEIWYLDSACSNHLTGEKNKFTMLDETYKAQVRLGNDKQVQIQGKGNVVVCSNGRKRTIKDVHYALGLAHNLISVGQLVEHGYSVIFENDLCCVKTSTGHKVLESNMTDNKMFPVEFECTDRCLITGTKSNDSEKWHQRYGHLYIQGLKLLANKEMVTGLPSIGELEKVCEGCALGKQTRKPFPKGKAKRDNQKLELIHTDICGPMRTESHAGSKFFLLFIDDFSRMNWVYFLSHKSEAFEHFKKFKVLVEKQCNQKIKILRSDRG